MGHPFLSDPWFDEAEKIRQELNPPSTDVTLNIVVTGGSLGDQELHFADGAMKKGLLENAPTKITVPYDVAKSVFIMGDQAAGMQAFMSGQIKVEGDMTRLMAMQGSAPSPEQQQFQQRIREITE